MREEQTIREYEEMMESDGIDDELRAKLRRLHSESQAKLDGLNALRGEVEHVDPWKIDRVAYYAMLTQLGSAYIAASGGLAQSVLPNVANLVADAIRPASEAVGEFLGQKVYE